MQDTKYNFSLLFSDQEMRDKRWEVFIRQPIGQLYLTIPFQKIAKRYCVKKHKCGKVPFFKTEGGIGLMFLKSYLKLSDAKLIERINTDWALQFFCGIRLGAGQMIKDTGIVSRWRMFLGKHLDEDEIQEILIEEWNADIEQKQTNVSDATCYESHVRYPTDVKLLWECLSWLHKNMIALSQYLKMRQPRNKFRDIKKAYLNYSRKRRKGYKKTKKMRGRLLYLIDKIFSQITPLIGFWKVQVQCLNRTNTTSQTPVKANFFEKLGLIKKVYRQQKLHFDRPDKRIANRIVSIAKPYLRPIVRGKETKRVEFGKKVHKMMVGGLGFIEYGSYDAFHEGVRTVKTIWKHRRYFGRCDHFGGDAIYANNKNRSYCSKNKIFTGFKRKGKAGKNEKQAKLLRSLIAQERSTVLEGSFGNEKNHYGLDRIKARTQHTEDAWIFFGMMCANAMKVAKMRAKKSNAPPR